MSATIKNLLLFIVIFSSLNSCTSQPQEFFYKPVPQKFFPSLNDIQRYNAEAQRNMGNAYDLTNSLPQNYSKTGNTDYTNYIQKGLNEHDTVLFPNFSVWVNAKGLSLKSNSVIIFQKYSKLLMLPNSNSAYNILGIIDKKNIVIFFPTIVGDRIVHESNCGEWGMGIAINRSSNIKIIHPIISNCWGDGIYIRGDDVQIITPILDNNRRNGISITDGSEINISSPLISNTNGTSPSSGIDIEPNYKSDEINNIVISNPITYNNENSGILILLFKILNLNKKNINIKIFDPVDSSCISGLLIRTPQSFIKGSIEIDNPIWLNNNKKIKAIVNNSDFLKVIINKKEQF